MMRTSRPAAWSRRAASAAIAVLLGAQLLASSRLLCLPRSIAEPLVPRVACAPALWPFLDYAMFNEAHRPGEIVPRDTLVALRAGGGELRVGPGLDRAGELASELMDALPSGDAARIARLARELELLRGSAWTELRLEREELALTRAGFVSAGTRVLARSTRDAAGAWTAAAP